MLSTLVLIKDYRQGKQRLASMLSPRQRADLTRAMFLDVLQALQGVVDLDIHVLSACDQVKQDALEAGVGFIHEPDFVASMNEAASYGESCLEKSIARQAGAELGSLMILHADMPLLCSQQLQHIVNVSSQADAAFQIITDSNNDGTNIFIKPFGNFAYQYGPGSCQKHIDQIKSLGFESVVQRLSSVDLDVDTENDLRLCYQQLSQSIDLQQRAKHSWALLSQFDQMFDEDPQAHILSSGKLDQLSKEPGVASREPCVSSEEPGVFSKEPCVFSEQSRVSQQPGQYTSYKAFSSALTKLSDSQLLSKAKAYRDQGFGSVVSYSPKVFLPLTHLCRDVCHYCTFTKTPKQLEQMYMSEQQVIEQVKQAEQAGCLEALLTLGEKPELRYKAARESLAAMGFSTTLEYVAFIAGKILENTSVLPHINAGNMTAEEIDMLKPVAASMGIMLESVSERLCEKGMPHYGSPDKLPKARLKTIALAGQKKVPFTTGILIGIGETREERLQSLWAIYELHQKYGHIQEIIIQNFRAKTDTLMAESPEPQLQELLWTIAAARLMFGPAMSIQAPPNLSPGELEQILHAGINDWGGVSPLTPDFVNPEAPWPHLDKLAAETALAGKVLKPRFTVYPQYIASDTLSQSAGSIQREKSTETGDMVNWLESDVYQRLLQQADASGWPREDRWLTGVTPDLPQGFSLNKQIPSDLINPDVVSIVQRLQGSQQVSDQEIALLLEQRGSEFDYICDQADKLRQQQVGDTVAYVVNRNINYTNVCYFKCKFCAFSKGKQSENLRGKPYDLSKEEIQRRVAEAWDRGATEVCMQGGIHPDYTGETYQQILQWVKQAQPEIHVHAFSPLEIWQGASTLGVSLGDYLAELKRQGLSTLPGTAAEILDDEVRAVICPDKINTEQWLEVMRQAHKQGIRSTATIMFGHVETSMHIARHLRRVRELQLETGGFTEFVPLPFVASESPVYLRGLARKGPTLTESILLHAVARLVLGDVIPNIQTSWVKMGLQGAQLCLQAGANDLGGTLMSESITRAAGASHGQEMSPEVLQSLIEGVGRQARQRTTLYQTPSDLQQQKSFGAAALQVQENTAISKQRYSSDKSENSRSVA